MKVYVFIVYFIPVNIYLISNNENIVMVLILSLVLVNYSYILLYIINIYYIIQNWNNSMVMSKKWFKQFQKHNKFSFYDRL